MRSKIIQIQAMPLSTKNGVLWFLWCLCEDGSVGQFTNGKWQVLSGPPLAVVPRSNAVPLLETELTQDEAANDGPNHA